MSPIEPQQIIEKAVEKINEIDKDKIKKELYLDRKDKGALDAIQERIISRKLLVFLVSTVLLYTSGLDSSTWGMIAMMYIGGQSAVDFAKVWKG